METLGLCSHRSGILSKLCGQSKEKGRIPSVLAVSSSYWGRMVLLSGQRGFSLNRAPLYRVALCPRKMTAVPVHPQTAHHKGSARLLGIILSSCSSRQVMDQDPESCCRAADLGLTCRSLLIAWPVRANESNFALGLCKMHHDLLCDRKTRKTVHLTSIRKEALHHENHENFQL